MENANLQRVWFFSSLLGFLLLDIASLGAYLYPWVQWALLPLLVVGVIAVCVRDRRWMFFLPFAELLWGSFGAGIAWEFGFVRLTLRMVLFAVIVTVWSWSAMKGRRIPATPSIPLKLLLVMAGVVVWGVVVGLYRGNDVAALYFDANAYAYLLYLPVWLSVVRDRDILPVTTLVVAAAVGLSLKTLVLFSAFLNQFPLLNPQFLYVWVRDTRIGELTPLANGMWRIFMQSQLYIAIGLLWALLLDGRHRVPHRILPASVCCAALLVSLSRSFWLGLAVTILFVLIVMAARESAGIRQAGRFLGSLAVSAVLGIVLVTFIIRVPYGRGSALDLLAYRVSDVSGEPSARSRVALLGPLTSAIQDHFFLGQGFGSGLAYYSHDPRVRSSIHPSGLRVATAFEWGYLEQLMKFGAVGFSVFMLAIIAVVARGARSLWGGGADRRLTLAMLSGLLFILAVHMVSPYLNHPLGLGYLMLAAISLYSTREHAHA